MSQDQPLERSQAGNATFVRWLARWAVFVAVLLIAFDVAVLRNYPFPDALEGLRPAFYTILGVSLVLTSIGFGFLGYRIVTLRYAGRIKAIYLIFLPPVLLVTSIVWLLMLSQAG